MANHYTEIAREANLSPMCCGNCGKKIDAGQPLADFFDLILRAIGRGEEVMVPNFGVFRGRLLKGRKLSKGCEEMTGATAFPDTLIIRFHQSLRAREKLRKYNEDFKRKSTTKAKKGKKET
jgi:hypothetical protein